MAMGTNSTVKSISFQLNDGPANALALSKDNSHVVVAGRNVFKILGIEDESFSEKLNLRVGKNLNLNYSCNDVVWSMNDESLIATGATNGAVVLWNLSKNTRAKQEHVFTDHQRTVHKVLFHPTDLGILISGSQDGTVKLFDIRGREAKITFKSNSESVRDIQFVPKNSFTFSSVSENGSVQLWDLRKGGERPFLTFTAHNGPVFSCDFHPENPSMFATGGRDRAIKVWTITTVATLEHTIQTVAPVGRIKWRPQRKHHIGSISLVVDSSVCVWDYRRPFVPFAAFEKHKDVATGITWKSSPHVFLSTSKDSTVWQNIFRDASRPASKAIPQALAINVTRGEIAQALTLLPSENTNSRFQIFKKSASPDENFHLAKSSLFTYESNMTKGSFSIDCAKRYNLNGKTAIELCEKNSETALSLNHPQASLVWQISKLYCQLLNNNARSSNEPEPSTASTILKKTIVDPVTSTPPKESSELHEDSHHYSDDDCNNNSSSETEKQDFLAEIASGLHMNQNLFMAPGPSYDFNYDMTPELQILPAEAFQPRHEIREGSSPPITLEDCSPREIEDEALETVAIENRTSELKITHMDPIPDFDFSHPLTQALHYHAERGDIQTAVSVWLVLSSVCQLDIPEKTVEGWSWAYVDLLQRHRLYSEAALVIKLSRVLGHLSQQSTTYLIACGSCGKTLRSRNRNFCEKCQKAVARCDVCHATVTGLMTWCQGCGHGGHEEHLRWWFSKNRSCPSGCGCSCGTMQ